MRLKKQKFPPQNLKEFGWMLLNWISSLWLASALLIILTVLTLFGTLNQMEDGLYDSVSKYFSSFFFYDKLLGMPIVLPGAYLILAILCVNMTLGTLFRIRQNMKNACLYGVHFSILFLIFAGFIEERFKVEGSMALFPGNQSDEYVSYHDWQLEVYEIDETGKGSEAFVIPATQYRKAAPGGEKTFFTKELPFELVVRDYARNCFIVSENTNGIEEIERPIVDGHVIFERPPEEESEANLPGVHLQFVPKNKEEGEKEAIIWSHIPYHMSDRFLQPTPHVFEMGGSRWAVQMVKKRFKLPFDVRLDKFLIEHYPGTSKAKTFQSTVTKLEPEREPKIYEIGMNEPMRDRGIVFFQSKWGPQGASGPDARYYSVFAVVDNPSDRWPEVAMYMILVFISAHFIIRMVMHSQKGNRPRTAAPGGSNTAAAESDEQTSEETK